MRFTSTDIARITKGRHTGPPTVIEGVSIDSRTVAPAELFVPVRAVRDGHDFIPHALGAGVTTYLTEHEPVGGTAIVVADTLTALHDLSRWARRRLPERVVAVTGSVGKTTVKELIRGAMAGVGTVVASPASFNNELGVPLTILNAPMPVDALVVEMGARGAGHIARLCTLAEPTMGVITTVGAAHLEQFRTLDDVASAKGELVEALPRSGLAVLNADDARVAAMTSRTQADVITYGLSAHATVRAVRIRIDRELRPAFTLRSPWGERRLQLTVRGRHQVANALAAATPALWSGLAIDQVVAGLERVPPQTGRMVVHHLRSGAVIIDDSYNANPTSVRAAFESLSAVAAERRFAVLGLMAELGDTGPQAHAEVAHEAASRGIDVIAVGTNLYGVAPTPMDEVRRWLAGLETGSAVLIKGSRVAGLERLLSES